ERERAGRANGESRGQHEDHVAEDERDNAAGAGAEGHADTDLVNAARDLESQDAEEADTRDDDGEQAEESAQRGEDALGGDGAVNDTGVGLGLAQPDGGVGLADEPLDRRRETHGVARDASQKRVPRGLVAFPLAPGD